MTRTREVKALLMRPLPPEGAFVTGPWGWGQSSAQAAALLRRYRSLLTIHGLTTAEIARSMVEWSQQKTRLRAQRHGNSAPQSVDDPTYVVQGMWRGGRLSDEFGFDDEAVAVSEAKRLLRSPHFEGDVVRVITRDGELVWPKDWAGAEKHGDLKLGISGRRSSRRSRGKRARR
jgi:hypothetical protein